MPVTFYDGLGICSAYQKAPSSKNLIMGNGHGHCHRQGKGCAYASAMATAKAMAKAQAMVSVSQYVERGMSPSI